MMSMHVQVTQPPLPSAAAVGLLDIKADRHLTHTDDDTMLRAFIKSAASQFEQITGRSLHLQTVLQTWKQSDSQELELVRWPVKSVSTVKVDGVALAAAAYDFLPGDDSVISCAKFKGANKVEVEYVSGYGNNPADIPEPIKDWITLNVGTRYEFREGLVVGADVKNTGALNALISPYKVRRFW